VSIGFQPHLLKMGRNSNPISPIRRLIEIALTAKSKAAKQPRREVDDQLSTNCKTNPKLRSGGALTPAPATLLFVVSLFEFCFRSAAATYKGRQ
jgi:hypothetical protein